MCPFFITQSLYKLLFVKKTMIRFGAQLTGLKFVKTFLLTLRPEMYKQDSNKWHDNISKSIHNGANLFLTEYSYFYLVALSQNE